MGGGRVSAGTGTDFDPERDAAGHGVVSETERVTDAFDAHSGRNAGVSRGLLPAFYAFNASIPNSGRVDQQAEGCTGCLEFWIGAAREGVEAWGATGVSVGWAGLELTFSRYAEEALGSTLLPVDHALDSGGAERETAFKHERRGVGRERAGAAEEAPNLDRQTAFTVGVYHDVSSWFELVSEYSSLDRQWFNGQEQDLEIFAVGGFFMW